MKGGSPRSPAAALAEVVVRNAEPHCSPAASEPLGAGFGNRLPAAALRVTPACSQWHGLSRYPGGVDRAESLRSGAPSGQAGPTGMT